MLGVPKLSFFSTVIQQILVYCVCNENVIGMKTEKFQSAVCEESRILHPAIVVLTAGLVHSNLHVSDGHVRYNLRKLQN